MVDRSYRRRRHSRDGDDNERFPYLEKSYRVFTIGAEGADISLRLRSPNSARRLAGELDRSDFLGRWMAHYIARADHRRRVSRTKATARPAEQAAAESILALWQRRAGLPGDQPPMHAFEPRIPRPGPPRRAAGPMALLPPFPQDTEPGPEDIISSTLLSLALNVEDSARRASAPS